jgi:hypothetical protein
LESIISSKAINKKQIRCLEILGQSKISGKFYLAGGTALAMLLEHRKSVDLNFFSYTNFNNDNFIEELSAAFKSKPLLNSASKGTLYITHDKVKISFIRFPYKMIDKEIKTSFNIKMAGLKDAAAMKLSAVTGRTSKKDFVDIYFLLKEKFSFGDIISFYIQKYGREIYNEVILTKSLMAFEITDNKGMPSMLKPFDWNNAKKYILEEAARYFRSHASGA